MSKDSKERFSDRVADYVKYRPDYPQAAVDLIYDACDSSKPLVADIGCGTGIFAHQLLAKGCRVTGIEPNENMRAASVAWLGGNGDFSAQAGSAEATGLGDSSVDIITAAQAFHWFNNDSAKAEFRRVLKPGGFVALVWNSRDLDDPFQREYEALLNELATDYSQISHMNLDFDDIAGFFDSKVKQHAFEHQQRFDFDGLLGRLHSSSYCPDRDTPEYAKLVSAMKTLFERYQEKSFLTFRYITDVYLGH